MPDENFARISSMLEGVKSDLVVLPELALSGYVFTSEEEVQSIAESIPEGKIFKSFRELSKEKDMSIVYGFAERAGKHIYNSAALINPDGSYHIYHKIHLFHREKLFFKPGDSPFAVYKAKGDVMVGLMICFDWQFPESARSLALKGAQILCHPSNLVLPWCQEAMKTRSLENRVFSITANRTGTESNGEHRRFFTGQSQIVNTIGEVLIRLDVDEEGVFSTIIEPDAALCKDVTELNNAFGDRRPSLYYWP